MKYQLFLFCIFSAFISSQKDIDEVIFRSDFVQDEFIPIWKKALQLYETGRYCGYCCCSSASLLNVFIKFLLFNESIT